MSTTALAVMKLTPLYSELNAISITEYTTHQRTHNDTYAKTNIIMRNCGMPPYSNILQVTPKFSTDGQIGIIKTLKCHSFPTINIVTKMKYMENIGMGNFDTYHHQSRFLCHQLQSDLVTWLKQN